MELAETVSKTPSSPPLGESAPIARDPFVAQFDNLIRADDDTLLTRGGGKGLRIYDELERDPHCYAVLQKRKLALISREWTLEPGGTSRADKTAAAICDEQLRALPFDLICLNLLDATLKGYAVGEILWANRAGTVAVDVLARAQRRFVFGRDYRPRLLTAQSLNDGEELPERKFIIHRFGSKDGNPYGLGLGTRLFWPVFFKRQGLQFWLTFADKFGNPTLWGQYPPGASPADKNTLRSALRAVSSEANISTPVGMDIKLLEAQRSGTVTTYESLLRYMDEEISKAVLGETMTTSGAGGGGGMGSNQASVQNEVRLEITKADADLLATTLRSTLLEWITFYNRPGAATPVLKWDFSEPEDLKARAERDQIIVAIGYEPTPQYIKDTYGDGFVKKVVPPPAGMAAGLQIAGPLTPADLAEPGRSAPRRNAGDQVADALEPFAAAITAQIADPVKRLVDSAADFAEVLAGIDRLAANLDATQHASLLRDAIALTHLRARADVRAE